MLSNTAKFHTTQKSSKFQFGGVVGSLAMPGKKSWTYCVMLWDAVRMLRTE